MPGDALSVGVTLCTLFVFSFVKGRFTRARPLKSPLQTAAIGGLAGVAAFTLAKALT